MCSRIAMLVCTLALMTVWLGIPRPAAAAIEINERSTFSDDFDSCTGERVLMSGTQHVVGQVTEDASGQTHFVNTSTLRGTGVGPESGADYLLIVKSAKSDLIGTTEGTTTVFTQVSQERFIRKGESIPNDDNIIHMLTRYTITPDGTLTAEVDIVRQECK